MGLSDPDFVHVFPLPPNLNCSGTVSAIHYCYDPDEGDGFYVFTLLILKQNGLTFTITNTIDVFDTTETSASCATLRRASTLLPRPICCDTMILDRNDLFTLPADNFAFGIVSFSLYAIRAGQIPQFLVEHFRFYPETVPDNTFTLTEESRFDRALRLFEFIIGKNPFPFPSSLSSPFPLLFPSVHIPLPPLPSSVLYHTQLTS